MRHIKLFENWNDGDYYVQMDRIPYVNGIYADDVNNIPFEEDEISRVRSILPPIKTIMDPYNDDRVTLYKPTPNKYRYSYRFLVNLKKQGINQLLITKLNDDWFFLEKSKFGAYYDSTHRDRKHVYFKCDQIDGLTQLIEDIMDEKKETIKKK